MATRIERDHWKALIQETRRRLSEPLAHPTFVLSLIGMTVFIGGLGVWWEVVCRVFGFHRLGSADMTDSWNIVNALATYLITLVAVSLMDLTIRREEEGVKAFRLVTILLATIAILLGFLALIAKSMCVATICASLGLLAGLFVWWVANADNTLLRDDPPPTATTGGDPDAAPAGTLEGIKA